MPSEPNPSGETGDSPEETKKTNCLLPAGQIYRVWGGPASFATEWLELTMGEHNGTLVFIVAPGIEWPWS